MEAIVKSLNQSDIVEGGSFTNKRQPIRSVPRSVIAHVFCMCMLHDDGTHLLPFPFNTFCISCLPGLSSQRLVLELQFGKAIFACKGEKLQQPCTLGKCRTQQQQLFVGVRRALWAKVQVSSDPQLHHVLHDQPLLFARSHRSACQ